MTPRELMDLLCDCRPQWAARREAIHADALYYPEIAGLGRELVAAAARGPGWVPRAFALIERALVEGDDEARNLVVVGMFEAIQGRVYRMADAEPVERWLGPRSKVAWADLIEGWTGVGIRTMEHWKRVLRNGPVTRMRLSSKGHEIELVPAEGSEVETWARPLVTPRWLGERESAGTPWAQLTIDGAQGPVWVTLGKLTREGCRVWTKEGRGLVDFAALQRAWPEARPFHPKMPVRLAARDLMGELLRLASVPKAEPERLHASGRYEDEARSLGRKLGARAPRREWMPKAIDVLEVGLRDGDDAARALVRTVLEAMQGAAVRARAGSDAKARLGTRAKKVWRELDQALTKQLDAASVVRDGPVTHVRLELDGASCECVPGAALTKVLQPFEAVMGQWEGSLRKVHGTLTVTGPDGVCEVELGRVDGSQCVARVGKRRYLLSLRELLAAWPEARQIVERGSGR